MNLTTCALQYIAQLKKECRYSSAHVYSQALRSFTEFCKTNEVRFTQINRDNLKAYQYYLIEERNLKMNTVSTYMRMLRSLYNIGTDKGLAKPVYRLFHEVFTGVTTEQKKALPVRDVHALLFSEVKDPVLKRTQKLLNVMFMFSGISFADLCLLKKSNLKNGILQYNRVKTKSPVSIELFNSCQLYLNSLLNKRPSIPGKPDYLFSILSGNYSKNDDNYYTEIQSKLHQFNAHIKKLRCICKITDPVSSYSIRHSWATIAKYRGVRIEMISESLGHQSIKTTQTYLKGFNLDERSKVNKKNYYYVKDYTGL